MERLELEETLHSSRERLRALTLPTSNDEGLSNAHFPRSTVMRYLFDPQRRAKLLTLGTAVGTFLSAGARRRSVGTLHWVLSSLADLLVDHRKNR